MGTLGRGDQDRPKQLPALLSPFTFFPPPPTCLPATFSLFWLHHFLFLPKALRACGTLGFSLS